MMDFIRVTYVTIADFLHDMANLVFGRILLMTLKPINDMFTNVYMPWARIVTLAFFIGVMVWVFVGLKKSYLAKDAPSNAIWYDLRVWTVISMLPHVIVYFFF